MHVFRASVFRNLLLASGKVQGARPRVFGKQKMGPGAHVREGSFWEGRRCLCLWCCLRLWRVSWSANDVFCAVSLSGTTTASLSTAASPAWSRDGTEFLCGQDHPGSENTYKHLCFGANLAVAHRLVSRVGVVCRREMCKNLLFITRFMVGVFFINRGPKRTCFFLFWASLLHTTIPKKSYIFLYITTPKTQGKQGPKRPAGHLVWLGKTGGEEGPQTARSETHQLGAEAGGSFRVFMAAYLHTASRCMKRHA